MKKFIIIIFAILVSFSAVPQSNETDLEQIQGTWKSSDGRGPNTTHVFKDNIYSIKYNGNALIEMEFYFSDEIEDTFDRSKIGKAVRGKYMICHIFRSAEDKDSTHCSVVRIVSINKNFIIWKTGDRNWAEKYERVSD